jgi:glycosyltransferase involved in cell wall biosynthesis
MNVALVHDYLNQYGGAERVLEGLHQLYFDAPIFTSVYDRMGMRELGFDDSNKDIRTSFMECLPFRGILPRYYFTLFYPFAFQLFDLSGFDVIISDASFAAKYVRKRPGAVHICYCHTPPRFLYGYDTDISTKQMYAAERWLSRFWKFWLRKLDQSRSRDVDVWVANSSSIAHKIQQAYGKTSTIVYPPVDLTRFECHAARDEGYYLVVSRLGEYKRVDMIVRAFNELALPLKVIGKGPQEALLRQIAQSNVEICGALPDGDVTEVYLGCKALVVVTEEDFGITPLEAMACGK